MLGKIIQLQWDMTLTAVINPVVPLNPPFPHQRVICHHSHLSAKYCIVTHNFTNDDLTDGSSPSYQSLVNIPQPYVAGLVRLVSRLLSWDLSFFPLVVLPTKTENRNQNGERINPTMNGGGPSVLIWGRKCRTLLGYKGKPLSGDKVMRTDERIRVQMIQKCVLNMQ